MLPPCSICSKVTDDSEKEKSESTSDGKQNVAKVEQNRKRKSLVILDYLRKKYEILKKKKYRKNKSKREGKRKTRKEKERGKIGIVKYDLEKRKVVALEVSAAYKLRKK